MRPLSISSTLSFPWDHPVAAYVFFFVFPSLLPFHLSILPSITCFTGCCYRDETLTFASHSKTNSKGYPSNQVFAGQQWLPRRTKNGELSTVFFSRVGLRTYQHPCRRQFLCKVWPEHRTGQTQDQAHSYQSLQRLPEVPLLANGEQRKTSLVTSRNTVLVKAPLQ